VFPQDEVNPSHSWAELATTHAIELSICITSALKHGMLDPTEADRYDRSHTTIDPLFTVAGLGQLVDACAHSDRVITFGG
jgi:tRNA 2-thiouridine synthesizing protein D